MVAEGERAGVVVERVEDFPLSFAEYQGEDEEAFFELASAEFALLAASFLASAGHESAVEGGGRSRAGRGLAAS